MSKEVNKAVAEDCRCCCKKNTQNEADDEERKIRKIGAGIDAFKDQSNLIITWSLAIFGGSLLVLLNTADYAHPKTLPLKEIYLCFVISWICLIISLSYAFDITGAVRAKNMYDNSEENMKDIFRKANRSLGIQMFFFKMALLSLAIWLMIYVYWWIYIMDK